MTSIKKRLKSILLLFSLLPFSASSFLPPSSLFGKVVNKINTDKKIIALSFDDGPNAVFTHQVLEILREEKIQATFFLNGINIPGNEILVRTMQVEGHSVGNHGFSHRRLDLILPLEINKEIDETQLLIESVIGKRDHLFRAPYGFYNNPFVMNYLKDKNYSVIGWSVDPLDWRQKDPQLIINEVLAQVKPGGIILLHDGPENKSGTVVDRTSTVKALPGIIKILKAEGYRFLTIPELLNEEKVLGKKTRRSIWNFWK